MEKIKLYLNVHALQPLQHFTTTHTQCYLFSHVGECINDIKIMWDMPVLAIN